MPQLESRAPSPDPESIKSAVASITARDPAFNLDALLADAQDAFWLVGQAHAQCKPELCEGILSAELSRRERATIEQECSSRTVMAPGDEDAKTAQLLSIATDSSGDTVTVHFVSLWHRAPGAGSQEERRVQNWCLHRPPGAQTVETAGGSRCANCGAVRSSAGATCRYCGALLGKGDGWRVIRIDDVSAQSAAEAAQAMRAIVKELVDARALPAPAARQYQPPHRRHRVGRMIRRVGFLLLVAFILVAAAAATTGQFHRDAAKFLPFIKHPELVGTLDLSGQIVATNQSTLQKPPIVEFGGKCATYSDRTSWDFTTKLPDASTFELQFSLPPDQGGAGTYRSPRLMVTATASNSQQSSSWDENSRSSGLLKLSADGGGRLQFSQLAPEAQDEGAITGSVTWTCSVR